MQFTILSQKEESSLLRVSGRGNVMALFNFLLNYRKSRQLLIPKLIAPVW